MNNDVLNLQNALGMTMRITTRAPFLMVGSIIAILVINWRLGLIMLAGYMVLVVIVAIITIVLINRYRDVQKNRDKSDRITRENVLGIKTIRAYANHDYEEKRFHEQNNALVKIQTKTAKVASLSSPIATLILNIVLVIVLWFSAGLINTGNFTTGQLLSLINYTAQLITASIALLNIILLYARSVISYERIAFVLKQETIIETGIKEIKDNSIQIKDVSITFDNHAKPIIKDINLDINSGEKIGIVGMTGSGKSVLLRLINGVETPNNGSVSIGNIPIDEINYHNLRSKIGYVSQTRSLLSGDIRFNIELGNSFSDQLLIDTLKLVNLEATNEFLDTQVYEGGTNLSGGQKQRINIARALVRRPKILLLDDIFSALDYRSQTIVKQALNNLDYQPTIVITSQELEAIVDCDRIVVLKENKIVSIDSHENLLKNCIFYQQLYQLQKKD